MANYNVTTFNTSVSPLKKVVDDMETYIETVDDTKDIISSGVIPVGDNAQGFIIHET